MKIYTKRGDEGNTQLASGESVSKANCRLSAYGTIDELNAIVGLLAADFEAKSALQKPAPFAVNAQLANIQSDLFATGGELAMSAIPGKAPDWLLAAESIKTLELQIDTMTEALPPLKTFILPGGSHLAATAHIARTVCRRAERETLAVQLEGLEVRPIVLQYLNRLSDWFFMLARLCLHLADQSEVAWKPGP